MNEQLERFCQKNAVFPAQIMYMIHKNRKTSIYFVGGRVVETFHTLKSLVGHFPETGFEIINKGIAVSPVYIRSFSSNVYTMTDGCQLTGRARSAPKGQELHQTAAPVAESLPAPQSAPAAEALAFPAYPTKPVAPDITSNPAPAPYIPPMPPTPDNPAVSLKDWGDFHIFDSMPLAFCVLELNSDDSGFGGIDFTFRYCNHAMEALEGKPISELINHTFREIFGSAEKKWLIAYADVAMNGTTRVIERYSEEVCAHLRIFCFQPKPNFCGCALVNLASCVSPVYYGY